MKRHYAVKYKISAPVLDTGRSRRLELTVGKTVDEEVVGSDKEENSMRECTQELTGKEVGDLYSSDCMRISYRNLTAYIVQMANYRSTIPSSSDFRGIPASSSAAVKPLISSNRIPRTENVLP